MLPSTLWWGDRSLWGGWRRRSRWQRGWAGRTTWRRWRFRFLKDHRLSRMTYLGSKIYPVGRLESICVYHIYMDCRHLFTTYMDHMWHICPHTCFHICANVRKISFCENSIFFDIYFMSVKPCLRKTTFWTVNTWYVIQTCNAHEIHMQLQMCTQMSWIYVYAHVRLYSKETWPT